MRRGIITRTLWRNLYDRLIVCLLAGPVFILIAGTGAARACGAPVCIAQYDALDLTEIITFEDLPGAAGPGRAVDGVLNGDGARFGERFAGQYIDTQTEFDVVAGLALAPLTPVSGRENEGIGIQKLYNNNILLGLGPARFPDRRAIGEGAIAVLFDTDQYAFGFRLLGGEGGAATVVFLRRDGHEVSRMSLGPLRENTFGFQREGHAQDIAGFILFNHDPEGIGIDDLIFSRDAQLSALAPNHQPRNATWRDFPFGS